MRVLLLSPLVVLLTAPSVYAQRDLALPDFGEPSSITADMIRSVDEAVDEECLTRETGGAGYKNQMEWQSCAADFSNSAELAAALSDETGTGLACFATSPTFTTSVTVNGYQDFQEIAEPAVPSENFIRLYAVDENGYTVLETKTDLGIVNRVGQDTFRIAKNTSGATIAANRAVYFTGSESGVPTFSMAKADSEATMPAIGMTTASVADDGITEIMIIGRIAGAKTDYGGWAEGDPLYLSSGTPGMLQKTRPVHPNLAQWIGTIEVVDASAGAILINVQDMFGIEDGTNRNSYTIGDTLTGDKTLCFDGADPDVCWTWASATSVMSLSAGAVHLTSPVFTTPDIGNATGNAATATALASNPTTCTNQFVRDIDADGTLTCETVTAADLGTDSVSADELNATGVEAELEAVLDLDELQGTLDVESGGTETTTLTDHGVLVGSGAAAITALTVGTNGQLLVGSTGADPVFATVNADRSLTATLGAGTFEIDADAELYTRTNCITVETPADADDLIWFRADLALTITGIDCIVEDATSAVITVEECDGNADNCAGVDGATTITCAVTNTADDGSLSNPSIDAADWVRLDVGAITGTPGHLTTCVTFTVDD